MGVTARLINRREEAQLRRALDLLSRIRTDRTPDMDDDTHGSYNAAVAAYGLEDLLEWGEREDEARQIESRLDDEPWG